MTAYKIKNDEYKKYEEQFRKTWIGNFASLTTKVISSCLLLPLIFGIYDTYFGNGDNFIIIMATFIIILLFTVIVALQYFNMVIDYINAKKE